MNNKSKIRGKKSSNNSAEIVILYNEYHQKVYYFISKRIGNKSDIDDLLQDTFIEAQKNLINYQGKSSISTWLLGISLNIVRNYYNRSPQYKYKFVDESEWNNQAVNNNKPETELDLQEQTMRVQYHINCLPDIYKEILRLYFYDGLSYEKIAELLNISLSAVKSRLFRAKKILKLKITNQ